VPCANFRRGAVKLEISERKKKILAAVVDSYIETAEPVGSKAIAAMEGMDVSSATIRNELAELERMGYLEQPHTSAGRIPTPQGYRLYVNELMEQHKLSLEETEAINHSLNAKIQELDKLMADVGQLTTSLTNYPALTLSAPAKCTVTRFDLIYIDANTFIVVALLSSNSVKNKLIHLPFSVEQSMVQKLSALFNAHFTGITEDEVTPVLISSVERAACDTMGLVSIIAGFAIGILSETASAARLTGSQNLLQLPEFRDPDKAHRLLNYLGDQEHLLSLPLPQGNGDVQVYIGPENVAEELKDSSVILASYDAGDNTRGLIGVVGPTRMDYAKVAAKLGYIANGISRLLATGNQPPEGWGKLTIMPAKGDDIDNGR